MINECLMHLRKKNAFLVTEEADHEEADPNSDMLDRLSAAEIFRLITQLPAGYRTVFNLFAVEDLTPITK